MKTPFNRRKPRSKDHIQPHTTFLKEQWGILSIRTNRTKVVCVSRLGELRHSGENPKSTGAANNDTGPASAPQDSLALLLEHLTGMHEFTTSRVLEFLRCGLPPQDHITWSTWKRVCWRVIRDYSASLSSRP